MSTRSGKRIHHSIPENIILDKAAPVVKSDRKTRSNRFKENDDSLNINLFTSKKRDNYVSYPTDDELVIDTVDIENKNSGLLPKNTLKEHNGAPAAKNFESNTDVKKYIRLTRRTKKLTENVAENPLDVDTQENHDTDTRKKPVSKKNKKKNNINMESVNENVPNKKKSKKKKGKKSDTAVVEEIDQGEGDQKNNMVNRSNMSVDSFHSAAGSPIHKEDVATNVKFKRVSDTSKDIYHVVHGKQTTTFDNNLIVNDADEGASRIMNKSLNAIVPLCETLSESTDSIIFQNKNGSLKKGSRRHKSSIKNTTLDGNVMSKLKDTTFDNDTDLSKSIDPLIIEKILVNNATLERDTEISTERLSIIDIQKSLIDNTFDKSTLESSNKINTTYDKDTDLSKSIDPLIIEKKSVNNATFDKDTEISTMGPSNKNIQKSIIDNTFDKSTLDSSNKINTTFDKESPLKSETKKKMSSIKVSTELGPKDSPSQGISVFKNSTFDKETIATKIEDGIFAEQSPLKSTERKSSIKDFTFDKKHESASTIKLNATFEMESVPQINGTEKRKSSIKKPTFDKDFDSASTTIMDTTFDNESASHLSETKKRKSTIKDSTFNNDPNTAHDTSSSLNITFESKNKRKSNINGYINSTFDKSSPKAIDITFVKDTKLDITFDKNSKSSIISSDRSNITDDEVSRISITSDDSSPCPNKTSNLDNSKANLMNTTPVLIESSMDESLIEKHTEVASVTPLKREGTFTKDGPEVTVMTPKTTPMKHMSLPSPGCTPFPVKISHKDKSVLNVTRSIEKESRSSPVQISRTTKVMFCSPVNNPIVVMQNKRKVIKSNLKGSNKSFVFEESEQSGRPKARKRSYTQGDAEDARAKRSRPAPPPHHAPHAVRPRTSSACAKLTEPTTPSQKKTPSNEKSGAKVARTKLPNFAAMHQKQFDKMESLDECQERRAKRARQLLTPTGAVTVLERSSPQGLLTEPEKPLKEIPKKAATPTKSLPTLDSLKPGYTRFGFKLNTDVNPFSIPCTNVKPKVMVKGLKRQATLPSLAGATAARRDAARHLVMREKSFADKRSVKRNENRTIIKGVRTNRRFELQMQLRNLD